MSWQQRAAQEAAEVWSFPAELVEVVEHRRVGTLTLFAAVYRDHRGIYKYYDPAILRGDGSIEWDEAAVGGEVLRELGLGQRELDPAEVANAMAHLVPGVQEPLRPVVDPERGDYYARHFGIEGVSPPVIDDVDGRPRVCFWASGGENPVTRVTFVLGPDGTATLDLR